MLKSTNFCFGLVFWAGLCLTLTPSAYAGPTPTNGSSVDSSTAAGDFFVPIEAVVVPTPVSGTQIEVSAGTGEITTSSELLRAVNTEAVTIVTQLVSGQVNSATLDGESSLLPLEIQEAIVNLLIADATIESPQIDTLASEISLAGVSPEARQDLLGALTGMCKCSLNSDSGVSTNGILPQCGEISVDLNQLSDAIIAYNNIVMSSDPENLLLLANDPEFLVLGQFLRALREPLESSSS